MLALARAASPLWVNFWLASVLDFVAGGARSQESTRCMLNRRIVEEHDFLQEVCEGCGPLLIVTHWQRE